MPYRLDEISINSTLSELWTGLNDAIGELNTIAYDDILAGTAITITSDSNTDSPRNAIISINLTPLGGIINTTEGLALDISGLSSKQITNSDMIVFEQYNTTDTVGSLRKVSASNMLPLNILGNHIFSNTSTDSYIAFDYNNVFLNSDNVLVQNPYLTLNYTLETDHDFIPKVAAFGGLKIPTASQIVKFEYTGSNDSWIANTNLGVAGGKFVNTSRPDLFLGLLSGQINPAIKMQLLNTHLETYFKIQVYSAENRVAFSFADESSNGSNISLFESVANSGSGISEFRTSKKFYIGDLANSRQFSSAPVTTYGGNYITQIIPYTNSNGVLNYNFTNRYVTSHYDSDIKVGDAVRVIVETNSTSRLSKAFSDTEETSNFIGIVEKISLSGKCYVALSGEFSLVTSSTLIENGIVYYLANEDTNGDTLTPHKPSTLVKSVVVGTGNNTGILFNSGSGQNPIFKNISTTNTEIADSHTFTPSIVNDTLHIKGGHGIIVTQDTNHNLLISAYNGSGTQPTFKTIKIGSTNLVALTPTSILTVAGFNGLTVAGVSGTSTLNFTAPNSYGKIQVVSNNTNQSDFLLQSNASNDTLTITAGIGITLEHSTNDDILIQATGVSVPGVRSVSNSILASMPSYSVKGSDSSGNPLDIQFPSIPAFTVDGSYNFYINDVLKLGRGPGGAGTPDEIAGYVLGRITDEYGETSEISGLSRLDLRDLIGISHTGFIQPLQDSFKYIHILSQNSQTTDDITLEANVVEDTLLFVAGTGVIISGNENSEHEKQITFNLDLENYITPLVKGFNKIRLDDGSYYNSSANDSILDLNETSTIVPIFGTTNNASVSFEVKDSSITNNKLSKMNPYAIKGNNDSTDENVTDISIGENTLIGRISSGEIKGLSSTQIKTLLGFSSSNYFKSISITDVTTTTINSITGSETIKLKAGTNITLSKDADNNIIINGAAVTAGGIKTVLTTDKETSSKITSRLIFDTFKHTTPLSADALENYSNISITPTFTSGDYRAAFDLSPMPLNTVKVAGTKYSSLGYVPSNLVINQGCVLGRKVGYNISSLNQADLREILGIKSISNVYISNLGTTQTYNLVNDTLKLIGRNGIAISRDSDGTIAFSLVSTNTSLFYDLTPTLGGNLNLNGKSFYQTGSGSLSSQSYKLIDIQTIADVGANPLFGLYISASTEEVIISSSLIKGSTNNGNLTLSGYNNGYVYIGNGRLSGGYEGYWNFVINSGTGVYELENNTSSPAVNTKITTGSNFDIESTTGNVNLLLNSSSGNSVLKFAKQSSEIRIYTDNITNKDIVMAAGWNGTTSNNNIVFRSNIILGSGVTLNTVSGNIQFEGGIQINDVDTEVSSTLITKELSLSYINNTLDTNTDYVVLDQKTHIYDIFVTDNNAISYQMGTKIKILAFGTSDLRIVTESAAVYSTVTPVGNAIRNLTFSVNWTGSAYEIVINNIGVHSSYTYRFTRLSF